MIWIAITLISMIAFATLWTIMKKDWDIRKTSLEFLEEIEQVHSEARAAETLEETIRVYEKISDLAIRSWHPSQVEQIDLIWNTLKSKKIW